MVARALTRELGDCFTGEDVHIVTVTDDAHARAVLAQSPNLLGCVIDSKLGDAERAGFDVVDAVRARYPDVPILIFSGQPPSTIAAEISGRMVFYAWKASDEAWEAVSTFARGLVQPNRSLDGDVAAIAYERSLSDEEAAYLRLYVEGRPDKENSARMGIPLGTLYNYKTRITKKLAVASMRRALFQLLRRVYRDL